MQPSPPLRCEMAVRAAALAQARTAELLGVPAPASHQSTSCSGRCKKQTGPALFAPGNSRAASAIPPAAWLTHRVPARPPPASVLHLPGLPLGAGLVCAKRRRGFPSEHQRIFSKGQRFLRAHLPIAPSLFVCFFFFVFSVADPEKSGAQIFGRRPFFLQDCYRAGGAVRSPRSAVGAGLFQIPPIFAWISPIPRLPTLKNRARKFSAGGPFSCRVAIAPAARFDPRDPPSAPASSKFPLFSRGSARFLGCRP